VAAIVALLFAVTALLSFDFSSGGVTADFAFRLFLEGWTAAVLVAFYLLAVLLRRREQSVA